MLVAAFTTTTTTTYLHVNSQAISCHCLMMDLVQFVVTGILLADKVIELRLSQLLQNKCGLYLVNKA